MRLRTSRILVFTITFLTMWLAAAAQDVTREFTASVHSDITITNKYGRVAVRAEEAADGKAIVPTLTASSAKGVSDGEIKIAGAAITVSPSDPKKRIDLIVIVPQRASIKIETAAGAIEVSGNFASVEALSDTGTIAADVPADDVKYLFQWTESRPRILADFDISPVKEKSAGRFEIKGRHREGEVKSKKEKGKTEDPIPELPDTGPVPGQKLKGKSLKPADGEISRSVALDFSTARGIILLNVPPGEVTSDLRERPLTEAAKAIVRSGDSLLMEAIRRASPKYFGDYARTLPPVSLEPKFATKSSRMDVPNAEVKTALVRVTDLQNRAISTLGAGDFEVTENGHSREVISVTHSDAPFNLVLLLDISGSVENYVNFIRKTARSFVDTVDKKDRVSIVIFNEDVKVLSKFTTDKGKLAESLDTFDAGGGTAYYDALAYTVADTLRPLKGERTAIVILTDGDDNRSFLAFDSLIGSIQESGALIYPLYVPSGLIALAASGADIDPLRRKYMSLTAKSEGEGDRLAKVSGGVYYPITQIGQIQKAYEDIVLQLRSAYNITYRSDPAMLTGEGASPRLKIRSKKPDTFVTINSVSAVR